MADNPFKIKLGKEVLINDICEIAKVTSRLETSSGECLYQVAGYSAIDGDLERWYKFEELTV